VNDPLLPGPAQPDDPIDQALTDAFANLSSRGVRPSMVDVQHRVHRRQRRRTVAMVGALAVVVAGGASVLATRADHTPLAITAGDGSSVPATTIACVEVVPTTRPPTTEPAIAEGTNTTYPPNLVPTFPPRVSITTDPSGAALYVPVTGLCQPTTANQWRCQGPVSTTSDGWAYFQYCEPVFADATTVPGIPATVVLTPEPSSTYPPGEITPTTGVVLPTSTISTP
jgi:hypothetical protein